MNFPDLETCREIAAEFPESEFVFASTYTRPEGEFCARQSICRHWDTIIVNSPTCEELGVWITSSPKMSDWAKKQTSHGIRQQIDSVIANLIADCAYSNKGETQARADAVALALKEAKK